MDRSYIVEAQSANSGQPKPVVAVIFMNSEPSKGFLADLGLVSISSMTEAKPLSRQPTEPTMYLFGRDGPLQEVAVTRFDWQGKVSSCVRINGEPHSIIPPVSGGSSDRLLYAPSAYVICGAVRDGPRLEPVVGVLFIKPAPGKPTPKAEMKTLKRFGMDKVSSMERVSACTDVAASAIYIFEKSPSASGVTVRRSPDWEDPRADTVEKVAGEPQDIIPKVAGAAADRFVYPRNALGRSDFPKPQSVVPPARPSSVRPSAAAEAELRRRNRT